MSNKSDFKLDSRLENDSIWICDLTLSQLRLIDDTQFKWCILVPMRHGIKESIDLSEPEQIDLMQESAKVSRALKKLYSPDKLNVAAIGNIVSQLHLHHICRFQDDIAWPAPVWGRQPLVNYSKQEAELVVQQIRTALLY